ncbi:MAG: bifunctional riboflavin kinase/FAD synthetase [Clostridia bacterium]|nr:bifunctional riboflavin kinase/FAD synthetase [Clostridia bacterium]
MIVYEYPFKQKLNIPDSVLALGFFDGVHIAHRDLLLKAREAAKEKGLAFGVFTFKSDGGIKSHAGRLYNDSEKAEIFESMGADFTVYADFGAIADTSPKDFVHSILCADLSCKICVAGFNFRFGKGASGDSNMLCNLMAEAGGECRICEEITADGVTLSATLIRNLISQGRVYEANNLLGGLYYIKGRVLHGRRDGSKIGFPTANIKIGDDRVVPKMGVYRSITTVDGEAYYSVCNVGTCPTFGENEIRLETHLIDYSGDLYDKEIRVYLIGFLREEKRFDSVDELKMQIYVDKNTTIKENGDTKWQELGLK